MSDNLEWHYLMTYVSFQSMADDSDPSSASQSYKHKKLFNLKVARWREKFTFKK